MPKSFQEVQVFLGFANFYYQFIQHYSQLVRLLTDLLKGSQNGRKAGPFEWPLKTVKAFCLLCNTFMTALILVHFNLNLKIRVETDASDYAIAVIILQLLATGL